MSMGGGYRKQSKEDEVADVLQGVGDARTKGRKTS